MTLPEITAKHLRGIHTGGNWTETCLKEILNDISLNEATQKVYDFNSILSLTYHTTYYVNGLLEVLQEKPLNTKDNLSFTTPSINSELEWVNFIKNVLEKADEAALLIEKMPERKLLESFTNEKYGTYYSNIHGIIEHMHYHLGQIALIKKLIRKETTR